MRRIMRRFGRTSKTVRITLLLLATGSVFGAIGLAMAGSSSSEPSSQVQADGVATSTTEAPPTTVVPEAIAVVSSGGRIAFPATVKAKVDEVNAQLERCLVANGATVRELGDGVKDISGGNVAKCTAEVQAAGALNASDLLRAADNSRRAASKTLWQCVALRTGEDISVVADKAAAGTLDQGALGPSCLSEARNAAHTSAAP
jgi:hypothetical protein